MTIAASESHPGVLQVLMDRPMSMNALNMEVVEGLSRSVTSGAARVVVVGSTSRASFSAGVDLKLSDLERAEVSRALYALYRDMRTTQAIVIAAAAGHAVGGGAQLMIAADLRIVGPDVSIRFLGPAHGLAVGAWRLPSLIGRGRAMDLMLSMRAVGAEEALSIGLVESIDAHPLQHALEVARHITSLSPEAVAAIKRIAAIPAEPEALRTERDFNDRWDGAMLTRAPDDDR